MNQSNYNPLNHSWDEVIKHMEGLESNNNKKMARTVAPATRMEVVVPAETTKNAPTTIQMVKLSIANPVP